MRTVLLIDDDDSFRSPTAQMLRDADWRVLEANDGEEGLNLARAERPDVILCDLLMPRVNGFQVCRAVREHLALRHTKIIVVTGRDYVADRKSAEEAGANDYLVKPLDFARLEAALTRVLPAHFFANTPEEAPTKPEPEVGATLKFWGVRGSIPTPGPGTVHYGGNTTCAEIRADGEHIIIDAGSGIRPLGAALLEEFGTRPIRLTMLLTHTHWDHIQGFPFFVPAYQSRNQIRILGYEGATKGLYTALAGQMEMPYFPVTIDDMPGHMSIEEQREMEFKVGRIRVETHFTNHPGICVGFKLHTSAGVIVFMPDNETPIPGKRNGHPTDFEPSLIRFIRGADILVHDAQYTAEEYEDHIGWGHASVDEAVRLGLTAGVKALYLFHHDPGHDDRFLTDMLIHARTIVANAGGGMRVEAAQEGQVVELARKNGG